MKFLTTVLFIITLSFASAQPKVDIAIKKVKDFYLAKNAGLMKGTFFFNKAENIIEIMGVQIPIFNVRCTYYFSDASYTSSNHLVQFKCSDGSNCLFKPEYDKLNESPRSSGFGIPFKTKDDCYTFINLIYELKSAIQ